MKKIRSSETAIPCTELSKTQFFLVNIVKFKLAVIEMKCLLFMDFFCYKIGFTGVCFDLLTYSHSSLFIKKWRKLTQGKTTGTIQYKNFEPGNSFGIWYWNSGSCLHNQLTSYNSIVLYKYYRLNI